MKLFKYKLFILLFCFVFIAGTCSIISYATIQNNKFEVQKKYAESAEFTILNIEEQEVLNLINDYRNQNNLPDLKPLAELQNIAYIKANDLITGNYFSHTSPILGDIFDLLEINNISYKIAGENLAGNISEPAAVTAWINSESHRDNILTTKYKYTGIAVVESEVYGKIFVQIFIG